MVDEDGRNNSIQDEEKTKYFHPNGQLQVVKTCKSLWIEEKEKREQKDENFTLDEFVKDKLTK